MPSPPMIVSTPVPARSVSSPSPPSRRSSPALPQRILSWELPDNSSAKLVPSRFSICFKESVSPNPSVAVYAPRSASTPAGSLMKVAVSLPSPPSRISSPFPPSRVSSPAIPNMRLSLSSPDRMSSKVDHVRFSTACRVSLPPPPVSWSPISDRDTVTPPVAPR